MAINPSAKMEIKRAQKTARKAPLVLSRPKSSKIEGLLMSFLTKTKEKGAASGLQ
jgi:hypothetical protein